MVLAKKKVRPKKVVQQPPIAEEPHQGSISPSPTDDEDDDDEKSDRVREIEALNAKTKEVNQIMKENVQKILANTEFLCLKLY